jgi:hypothetical protein
LGSISETVISANTNSYSVAFIGQATYSWTVPAGMTIISGQGSTQITVSRIGVINGVVSVIASNTCLSQSNSSSLSINLSAAVVFNSTAVGPVGSMQYWTVPAGVTQITIEAFGAQAGNYAGKGARMKGTFTVIPGQNIKILVGQKGLDGSGGGGGGGTFITDENNNPLIVAGGGSAGPAPITNAGNTNGGGGSCAGGGGGLTGNGGDAASSGGKSFVNGGFGTGGCSAGAGGYGGGAGGESWCWCGSNNYGGGGGYNGGAGNSGGGSYNTGTNQSNTAGVQPGDGKVIITW